MNRNQRAKRKRLNAIALQQEINANPRNIYRPAGKTLKTELTASERLISHFDQMMKRDRRRTSRFATDLLRQYNTKGSLSGKQWHSVKVLIADWDGKPRPD